MDAKLETAKPVHSLVLDAGPIISNSPSVSTLLAHSEQLYTVPAVLAEIRDAATRSRVETTLSPFLKPRAPRAASVKVVSDFAAKTGDLAALSGPDLQVLALAYELECERNGGDWRLRRVPGQKGLNGPKPQELRDKERKEKQPKGNEEAKEEAKGQTEVSSAVSLENTPPDHAIATDERNSRDPLAESTFETFPKGTAEMIRGSEKADQVEEAAPEPEKSDGQEQPNGVPQQADTTGDLSNAASSMTISATTADENVNPSNSPTVTNNNNAEYQSNPTKQESQDAISLSSSDSDSDGWITPSNIKKHQLADMTGSSRGATQQPPAHMAVATLTSDFAMQNVLLQMNLHLLGSGAGSNALPRVRHLRSSILRCHACFATTREQARQFCPRCGGPTLTRVGCSVDAETGRTRLHLKRNFQWNNRGNRYSVPKPVADSASGKAGGGKKKGSGGGKGGWGQDLILAEDQKEYVRAVQQAKREKKRDLMDEDYLPAILSGDRSGLGGGGRPKVGAGRNVNSRKR
ncbi:Nin one binding Zn-ribbon like-domain-containing protein [Lineolata rhizophorae]|uniref:20S-pre-rRNA D-site endonuclease NOB1 n=1 Tax=Lineolata rhizophorae TaxID=578093 RepID=A0A6A6NW39_9PEZI|nr:Nin one binding Zn-ribbon like-domain-containing protein [Lineolata rhizophorae]